MELKYKDNLPLDARKARTNAIKLANLTGVNHVIVKIGNYYNVYTEKEYPKDYIELIKPEIKSEIVVEKERKTRSNAVPKA